MSKIHYFWSYNWLLEFPDEDDSVFLTPPKPGRNEEKETNLDVVITVAEGGGILLPSLVSPYYQLLKSYGNDNIQVGLLLLFSPWLGGGVPK
jgi:hypothetical protein